jgi:CheY-like chemotaxis protein
MQALRPAAPAGTIDADAGTRPLRVLVVSDRELWLRSLDSVLGSCGYEIASAASGGEAVERVDHTRPDALILAAALPDMSGISLCRQLRDTGRIGSAIPVIVITSGPCTREERLDALRAGAWECYGFPLDPETLLLKLEIYANASVRP